MNNTVINIDGIKVNQQVIRLENSTDKSYLLTVKDEHGTEVYIRIINDKIDSFNGTYSCSINK